MTTGEVLAVTDASDYRGKNYGRKETRMTMAGQ